MWNFQPPTLIQLKATQRKPTLPGSSRSPSAFTGGRGGSGQVGAGMDVSLRSLPEDNPSTHPTFSSISTTQCRRAGLPPRLGMPQTWQVSPRNFHRHQHQDCSWHALKAKGSLGAPPWPPSWRTAVAAQGRKSVWLQTEWASLRLMQPQTDSGLSSIITPLSLWDLSRNEACFLPGAISFYPGWRLKADQWGNNVWCHFHYSNSLPASFSLSETHRTINSSQKWLKNALGACIFQKSILCYICLCYFGRNCLHRTKQKKWGREKNLKLSCRLETWWLEFNPNRGKGRMPLTFESHVQKVKGDLTDIKHLTFFKALRIWKISCYLLQEAQPLPCMPEGHPLRTRAACYRWGTWVDGRKALLWDLK